MQCDPKLGKLHVPIPVALRLMTQPSSPYREDTLSEILLSMQRQLAPTVVPEASGGQNRAGSAFAGIGDTLSVERVQYAGRYPIIPPDMYWIPAKTDAVKLSIIPFGGIHLFIGETANSDGNALVSST